MMLLIHIVLIVFLVLPAVYYFIFAVAGRCTSSRKEAGKTDPPSEQGRFFILIPAYMSDSFIMPTVCSALNQDYPGDRFKVLVIADSMRDDTIRLITQKGAEVLEVSFTNSTKAASLNAAANHLEEDAADYAVILDSDNIVGQDFLSKLNGVLRGRNIAVQGHRCAKNSDTPIAIADGIFEEVNNLVFRQGHCALGLSSALVGSGMALPLGWFKANARKFVTVGEDKEMELQLLRDGIFVEYAPGIDILDEKTRSVKNLQKQRLRWLTSQYYLISNALKGFSDVTFKAGYADKLLQWTFLPRIIIFTGLPLTALLSLIAGSSLMSVYVAGTILLYAGIALGIPGHVSMRDLLSVLMEVPRMLGVTVRNIFIRKQGKDKFIHTDHQ